MQYCSICSALYVSRLAALRWAGGNDRPGQAPQTEACADDCKARPVASLACAKIFTPGWSGMLDVGVVTCATNHESVVQPSTGSVQGARPGKTPVEL
jgi:hypothetical protein